MRFSILATTLSTFVMVSAVPTGEVARGLVARDPSDTSPNSHVAFECTEVDVPTPGGGQGGSSVSYLKIGIQGGDDHGPPACEKIDDFCQNCIFEDTALSSPTNVTTCYNPMGGYKGCSLQFSYNGYDFDTQNSEPTCGHTSSFAPFSGTLTAICYFNV